MAENVRGQGNRDQNRNLQNEDPTKVSQGRNQSGQMQNEQSENINTSTEPSQRGSMGNQKGMERGSSGRSSNRQQPFGE